MTVKNFPKISIIIPNYNDAQTLSSCLKAALNSDYPNFEIIVVDDKSTDNSIEIIKKFNVKLLVHEKNLRQGAARNTGAKQADGEILFFTDGDVCIKKDTLTKIANMLLQKKDIAAVVGLPDKICVYKNLTSKHFNRRIHFNYLKLPDYINVLYGTISAVKKEAFKKIGGFNEHITGVEDNEIGYRLANAGYKIYHSKDISVIHRKKIGFIKILKNDFNRTVDRMKLLLGSRQMKNVIKEKRFITSPMYQLLSPFVSSLFFASLLLGIIFYKPLIILSVLALLLFFLLNLGYLFFNFNEDGLFFSIKLFFFLIFDMLIVSFGLIWGSLLYLKGERF
jgi:glycosyltransferase involved in cell wall biosynthesis